MGTKPPPTLLTLPLHRRQEQARKAERARAQLRAPARTVAPSTPVVPLTAPSYAEQRRALRVMVDGLRDAVGARAIGDCFAFGLRNEVSAGALCDTLDEVGLGHVRRFSWACSLPRGPRGSVDLGWAALNAENLSALRSRHRVRRVSLVLVGNDFVPTSGGLLRELEPLLADQLLWIICRQSIVPTPDVALAELSLQARFSVLPVGLFGAGALGASWLALRLGRNQPV
jgi:hypothetical protein